MPAKILSGIEARDALLAEISREVRDIVKNHGVAPGLVTILVGDNPASVSYVTQKARTAHELGFVETQDSQSADITEAALLALIEGYNRDETVHGILVQLPLPGHIDEQKVIMAIDPDKDVDGFHPINAGRLLIGGENVRFPPCTPAGIQELIKRAGVETRGAEVVIVGRSNIVGKPLANMLMAKGPGANATVTVVHTATQNPEDHCRRADILVVAAGVPGLVRSSWIKPGACVIDVGVNRIGEKISEKTGKKVALLAGDVDFETAAEVAGWITPVPGGVGPMTIAMLMKNTLRSLEHRLRIA